MSPFQGTSQFARLSEKRIARLNRSRDLCSKKYKALTMTQPWTTLVAIGAKRLETRSWSTPYRGPLAIHAARGLTGLTEAEFVALCQSEPFVSALAEAGLSDPAMLPRGAIIAVCDLVDVQRITPMDKLPPEPERSFGNYAPGRYAWRLNNVWALPAPIPARGALWLWDWQPPAELNLKGGL
jgi:hypothetical protein